MFSQSRYAAIVVAANTARSYIPQRRLVALPRLDHKLMTLYLCSSSQSGRLSVNDQIVVSRTPPACRRPSWASRPARPSASTNAIRAVAIKSANDMAARSPKVGGSESRFAP